MLFSMNCCSAAAWDVPEYTKRFTIWFLSSDDEQMEGIRGGYFKGKSLS